MVSGALEANSLSGIQMVSPSWANKYLDCWFHFSHLQSNKQSVISILGLLLVSKQLGAQSPRKPLVTHYVIIVWNPAASTKHRCSGKTKCFKVCQWPPERFQWGLGNVVSFKSKNTIPTLWRCCSTEGTQQLPFILGGKVRKPWDENLASRIENALWVGLPGGQ